MDTSKMDKSALLRYLEGRTVYTADNESHKVENGYFMSKYGRAKLSDYPVSQLRLLAKTSKY